MNKDNIIQRQAETLLNEAINTAFNWDLNRDSVKASIAKKFGFNDVDYKN